MSDRRDPREPQWLPVEAFTRSLARLSADGIRALAAGVWEANTPADDVAWWKATLAVDRGLKTTGRLRQASFAAHRAAQAVLAAAEAAGMPRRDPAAVTAARAAAQAARALVAHQAAPAGAAYFLARWPQLAPAGPPNVGADAA